MYSYLKVCSNVFVLGGNTEFSSSFLLGLCLLNPEGFNKRQHHLPALDSGSTIPLSCFSVLSSCLESRISGPFPSLCLGFIHVSPKSSSLRQHLHMPFRGPYRHSYTKINWLSIWNADVTGYPYPHLLNLAACARMSWRSFWHTVEGTATALLKGAQNGCGHHNWMQNGAWWPEPLSPVCSEVLHCGVHGEQHFPKFSITTALGWKFSSKVIPS